MQLQFYKYPTQKIGYYWKELPQNFIAIVMLVRCLKQVKDFILQFSINGSFFSVRQNYIIVLYLYY